MAPTQFVLLAARAVVTGGQEPELPGAGAVKRKEGGRDDSKVAPSVGRSVGLLPRFSSSEAIGPTDLRKEAVAAAATAADEWQWRRRRRRRRASHMDCPSLATMHGSAGGGGHGGGGGGGGVGSPADAENSGAPPVAVAAAAAAGPPRPSDFRKE